MEKPEILDSPLKLPCGAVLRNRIGKSAMSESLGDSRHLPTKKLRTLYEQWGQGGLGLIITGNVMVDRAAYGEPGNVALEERDRDVLSLYREWAAAASTDGAAVWVQLNHPGRQAMSGSTDIVAPSAVAVELPGFGKPRALNEREIRRLISRFAESAALVKEAGFHGVQVHGAHGYLVSQFLSPRVNRRSDEWGGSLDNRMRFLLEICREIRKACGADFPVGVKLNSSDFQKGGLEEEDSAIVCRNLEECGVDMVELSGGSYEKAAMTGAGGAGNAREAYFLDFAARIKKQLSIPVMLTGGFRSAPAMESAVESKSCDLVGLARPLALEPHLARQMLSGERRRSKVTPIKTGIAPLDKMGLLELGWYNLQLEKMGKGNLPDANLPWFLAMPQLLVKYGLQMWNVRRGQY